MRAEIKDLVGKVLTEVILDREQDTIKFVDTEGGEYLMYHQQACCERVYIEDICGDLQDLVGSPILVAEENCDCNESSTWTFESSTWTFYKLATAKGYVDLRWYGESNGYYSESVDFIKKGGWDDWF